ncbi:hemin-degrading factor [Pollutimonas bauzanensis]|uniref:Putative hemin transport protein n=1 Tax=Pollutimonas bauzanensis TaxID=658167 RepID=A0A1M5YYF9_9BURK|nr:ChuX/HutX family heme-like substrate-binding protein [Pollutimonas bauzanensis]SHI16878.1 putative hemin transport protein [Pollutimonas bauzanensis]
MTITLERQAGPREAGPLRERYARIKAENPKARIRNVAQQMSVSELELVAANCGDIQSTLLREPAQDIFKQLGSLGRVMALTRNDWCVHERHGKYEDIRAGKTMGIVLGPDIDLRVFFSEWKSAWAVSDGGRLSIQFFDAAGGAIHKVYVTGETDVDAYHALVRQFADPHPAWPAIIPLQAARDDTLPQAPAQLRADWLAMEDTHQFHGLLKRHNVSRLAALRGAGADLAQEVSNDTAERMLQDVAARDIPFMCFVGNRGMIQIHTGPVRKLMRMGPWFNVLEPHFNLHLDTTAIVSTWIVNKPTVDGWVTSVECYAGDGGLIAQFFGARKPGVPELADWRNLLAGYCPVPLAA